MRSNNGSRISMSSSVSLTSNTISGRVSVTEISSFCKARVSLETVDRLSDPSSVMALRRINLVRFCLRSLPHRNGFGFSVARTTSLFNPYYFVVYQEYVRTAGDADVQNTPNITFTLTRVTSAVPETATWDIWHSVPDR